MPGIPPAVIRGLFEEAGPIFYKIGNLFRRGAVKVIDDRRALQFVSTVISAGEFLMGLPVHQPFGFNSHAPLDGAVTHVFQNSADPADLIALMPSNPAAMRMGGLREGESILYDAAGQKLHFQNGRVVAVDATEGMVINQKGQPLLTLSEQGHVFYGDLYVKGHIFADKDVTGGGVSLGDHAHNGVKKGEEDTGKPGGGNKPPEPPKPPEPEPPEELPPWRETKETFIGEKGTSNDIRIMPESDDPKIAAETFFQQIVKWFAKNGNKLTGMHPIFSTKNGVRIQTGEIGNFSDGTVATLRPESGRFTPDGWYNIDIGGNADVNSSLQDKSTLKIKFPLK